MGDRTLLGIAIFLGLIAAAAGIAYWNDRRSGVTEAPREREEPRFPLAPF